MMMEFFKILLFFKSVCEGYLMLIRVCFINNLIKRLYFAKLLGNLWGMRVDGRKLLWVFFLLVNEGFDV